jgi:solute carrier family 35 protein F1/2
MLLDCFTIPMAIVLSVIMLRARYNRYHIIGVVLCISGLVCTVYSDTQKRSNDRYPHAVWGDILCLIGASLYAASNVLQEYIVKTHSRVRISFS